MLDHLEGNLSPQDTLALKAFALLHPELELNFDEELVSLEQESVLFENKQNLKVKFNDELVIGYLENVLEGKEKQEAEILAANNALFKRELDLYKKTIAVADTSIVFENKEGLKRRAAIILFPQNNYVRVAAALLLLFGLWFMVSRLVNDNVKVSPEMANTKKDAATVKEVEDNSTDNNVLPRKTQEEIITSSSNKLVAKKTTNSSIINTVPKKEEINTSTINIIPDKKEEPNIVDVDLKPEEPFIKPDTNSVIVANNSPNEKISQKYIIEEGLDVGESVAAQPKSKLWNFASGLLKRLNKRGVENVNSSENNNAMLIGALTISKPN